VVNYQGSQNFEGGAGVTTLIGLGSVLTEAKMIDITEVYHSDLYILLALKNTKPSLQN